MFFMLHFKLLPLKSLKLCEMNLFDKLPSLLQVLNTSSKRQVMDIIILLYKIYYIAIGLSKMLTKMIYN